MTITFTCAAGESFDSVALLLYGDEKYAGDLMLANPEMCGVLVFSGGEELYVPELDVPEDSDDVEEEALSTVNAPWRTEG